MISDIDNASAPAPWVALVVRSSAERKVQTALANVGVETFVPWHGVRRRWSDRFKTVDENLFPGYVFCRSRFSERSMVLRQPGVARVVSFDSVPALIPDAEISTLRRLVSAELPLSPWPYLKAGQRVRIERGPLAGIEGTLARDAAGWRVVMNVETVQRSIAVAVDRDMIWVLNPK